jgi:hypothetical protein
MDKISYFIVYFCSYGYNVLKYSIINKKSTVCWDPRLHLQPAVRHNVSSIVPLLFLPNSQPSRIGDHLRSIFQVQ